MELYAATAFLVGDPEDAAFGNTILRHVRDVLRPATTDPCPFETNGLATLLCDFEERLEPDLRAYVRDLLLALAPHGMTRDFQFHGYNDNMPVMWSWALSFAGDYFDRDDFRRIALANLLQLKDMLRRRGTVSEYGQGYSTHRLTGISRIVEHTADPAMRQLALDLEARLWAELAGHWNPALGVFGGGSMRGGWPVNAETTPLLMHVLRDALAKPWANRERYYDTTDTLVSLGLDPREYLFCYPFCYLAEFAGSVYHVPDAIAPLFYGKPAGSDFACTAEAGYVNEGVFMKKREVKGIGGVHKGIELTREEVVIKDFPEHGAQPHGLRTYHGANYTLGSSTQNMFTTSHAMQCHYRRTLSPAGLADLGGLFIRYNINGKVPGGRHPNTYRKSPDYEETADNYCCLYRDQGRHACLQHENTILCLMTPEWREWWDVRSLHADLCFYQPEGKVRHWELSADGSRLDVNEGAVYLSIFPLIGRHLEREEAIRIREQHEWLVVSVYNYEGPSRAFDKRTMAKLGNGFVLEIRDAADYASFEAFQAEMARARLLDQLYGGRRRVHYARPDLRLSTHYCPYTHTVMQASVNGLERQTPHLWLSGGQHAGLPFLDDTPAPGFEDWDWIETQHQRPPEPYNLVD